MTEEEKCEIEMNLTDSVDLNIKISDHRMERIEETLRETIGKEEMNHALAILSSYGINIH